MDQGAGSSHLPNQPRCRWRRVLRGAHLQLGYVAQSSSLGSTVRDAHSICSLAPNEYIFHFLK